MEVIIDGVRYVPASDAGHEQEVPDLSAPEPLYQQLAQILRQQIASGQMPHRSKLPTLNDLASKHELAVTTVQKAIALLKDEGLIVAYPGRGMFVK